MSNPTIDVQMAHRSIRAYTEEKLTSDEVTTLLEVARHTASSSFLQQMTTLHITDPAIREEFFKASGQPYVGGDLGDLFVFIVDLYRNAKIREEAGIGNEALSSTNLFLIGCQDVLLGAQNMVVAAESMGLGTVYLGSINADPERIIKALELPKYTFPLLGLLVGHPAQEPQFKPRLPLGIVSGENTYPKVESYSQLIADYDQVITRYYDLRDGGARYETFTNLVRTTIGKGGAHVSPMLRILNDQGLCLS
ncbi:NADPH-dependent oxidoreductase [Schaalia vaccimaxillae]|uniref:NADPH-dependent oxidoreductase n=1 Tax=Schaalia vaccimaxillae TaxID=183916 RepID=UPI000479FAAA|nr:NADPH-dependent oxidoreductase [Schaalia vaccimaxillae]